MAAEAYQAIAAAVANGTVGNHPDEFNKLLSFAEAVETPVNIRVKSVELIAQNAGVFDLGKKIAQLAVKVLSTAEETPLLVATTRLFVALSKLPAEKKPENFSQGGADVLMQIQMDAEGFNDTVRAAAKSAVREMVNSSANLKGIVTKVVYWLCDNREEELDHLQKERSFALKFLHELVSDAAYAPLWTEDVQQQLLTCLVVPMSTAPHNEFLEQVHLASALPIMKERKGVPLVDAYLGQIKNITNERHYESLAALSAFVGEGAKCPALVDHYLSKKLITKLNLAEEKAATPRALLLYFVSRVASSEQREKLLAPVLDIIKGGALPSSSTSIPANLTATEALLLSVSFLAHEHGAPFLAALNDEAFVSKIVAALEAVSQLLKFVTFQVRKSVQGASVPQGLAEAYSCLANLHEILEKWKDKKLLSITVVPSWRKPRNLPHVKRQRTEDVPARGAKYRPQQK